MKEAGINEIKNKKTKPFGWFINSDKFVSCI
jgi:hypothetical protein